MNRRVSPPASATPDADKASDRPRRAHWSDVILGRDRKMRVAMQHTLLATFICIVWLGVEIDAHHCGKLTGAALRGLLIFNIIGLIGFLSALRSGWSERLRDPSMNQGQMIFAAMSMAAPYALLPHVRAAALQVMCLTLVFGMFRLTPRETLRMGWLTSGVLLCAVGLLGLHKAGEFSLRVDLLPAVIACFIMLAISVVLSHFSRMRMRLSEQRQALRATMQQVEELAIRDGLTGLYNRRHIQQQLEQECLRHARSGTPLALALIDLDHFKRINDTHGHHVGDEVLVAAARVMGEHLRVTDLIGRWGGEEFLLLLPDTPAANARLVLDRVRASLSEQAISVSVPALRVSFSAGLSEFRDGRQPQVMLEQADRALYEAKAAGRNRCCVCDPDEHRPGATHDTRTDTNTNTYTPGFQNAAQLGTVQVGEHQV